MGWAQRTRAGAVSHDAYEAARLRRATAKLKDLAGTLKNPAQFERVMATVRPDMEAEVRALLTPLLPFQAPAEPLVLDRRHEMTITILPDEEGVQA